MAGVRLARRAGDRAQNLGFQSEARGLHAGYLRRWPCGGVGVGGVH